MAPQFLGLVRKNINLLLQGQFCTYSIVHICLTFFDLLIEIALEYKILKPHMNFLVYKGFFPTILLAPEDIHLFECEPHEFMHH